MEGGGEEEEGRRDKIGNEVEQPQYWLCSGSTHPPTWL